MEAIEDREHLTLDELYDGYVKACGDLQIVPLPRRYLLALLQALAKRDAAILH